MLSRRNLLASVFSLLVTPACAQTTLLSGSPINAFNGGRSQINLSTNFGGEFPFIDVVKSSQDWNYASAPNANGQVSPGLRDANGYPTSIQTGGYYGVCNVPSQTERPGNYVCRWIGGGAGTVMRQPGTLVSGSVSGANGRFIFSTSSTSFNPGVTTMGSPYVTSISVMHVGDEAAWLAGEVFGTQFLAVMRQANFGVIRFLNWTLGNTSTVTTWASRKPVGYFSYTTWQWNPALWAGQTTNSGNDYSLTFGSGAPVDKQTIHLQWNADSTVAGSTVTITNSASTGVAAVAGLVAHGLSVGTLIAFGGTLPAPMSGGRNFFVSNVIDADHFNFSQTSGGSNFFTTSAGNGAFTVSVPATLNLNGTGAIPIKNQAGDPAKDGGKPTAVNSGGGVIFGTVVYDDQLKSWLMFGGNAGEQTNGINNGVPVETCLQLCVELGAHPYFTAPYLSLDPMTDYHTGLATFLKASASSWMIPRIEGVNEQWNSGGGFYGTRLGWAKANLHWGTTFDSNNWQGLTMSTIGQAVNAAYGGAIGAGYQLINGAQTTTFSSTGGANGNDARMTSALYVSSGPAQVGFTQTAASNWCTHLCIANYFNPTERGTAQETTDAAAYAAAAGNAPLQLSIATAYADTVGGVAGGTFPNLAGLAAIYGFAFAWAQKFTNSAGNKLKMCGYEGGYSPDVGVGETAQVKALRLASKFVDDIGKALIGGTLVSGDTVAGTYVDFINAGGENPSCFQDTGTGNIWSVLDPDVYVTPQPGQWTAIATFNH